MKVGIIFAYIMRYKKQKYMIIATKNVYIKKIIALL